MSYLVLMLLVSATAILAQSMLSPSIPHFTQHNFKNKVMGVEQTTLVLYYAPWCGHCKQFKPQYEQAARKLKGIAKLGAVNCDEEKQLCAEAGVGGFPTLKGYYTNAKSRKRITVDYQGDRTAATVISFAQDRLPSFVKAIRANGITLDKFYSLENATLPKVVVVKPPSRAIKPTSVLLKALAIDYHYRLLFGEVTGENAEDPVYAEIDVQPPASGAHVIVIQPGSNQVVAYPGEIKQDQLRKFLDQYALKDKIDRSGTRKDEKKTSVKEDAPSREEL